MMNLEKLYLIKVPNNLLIISKEKICTCFVYIGFLIAYLGSLNPWFMWPLGSFYIVLSSFFLCSSIAIAATRESDTLFQYTNYLAPTIIYIILSYYLLTINGGHIGGFLLNLFNVSIFFSLFIVNKDFLLSISTVIAKFMAVLLAISLVGYFLFLFGFPLPSVNDEFAEGLYTYRNYFLFLFNDAAEFDLFPRFHAVFLEPGHLGSACVILLLTQYGQWRKWYNVILLIATLITFSLAAYVLLVIAIFLNLWMQNKRVFSKIIIMTSFLATIIVASFYYNNGNNLLHDLILLRLEVYDGEMVGNNRVTDEFDTEYENYLNSSDIVTGRDMPKDAFGNSGYKVFIYENGLIGLILVILLYFTALKHATNYRFLVASIIMAFLSFIVRGYPLWYSNFIVFYIIAYLRNTNQNVFLTLTEE